MAPRWKLNDKKYIKKWRREHPERVRAWEKKCLSNPDRYKKKLERNRRWRLRNVNKVLKIGVAYRAKHRSEARAASTEWRRKLSEDVKRFLGGKCVCCGIKEPGFLTVDHIKNDGKLCTRNSNGTRNNFYYYREIRKAFQSGKVSEVKRIERKYRLLCFNCNNARSICGKCPHERAREFKALK
jgi:hypothetical protein